VGPFLAFVGISALIIVVPGQDTALTIRNTLAGGRDAGVRTALGISSGLAVWALAAAAGLAALLRASEPAFLALRVAGAAYLVYLGVQALRSAVRGGGTVHLAARRGAPYRQGFLSNLGNPKIAVFFTSLLPQFGHSFGALLALGLVFCVMTFAWLAPSALVVARAGDVLRRSRARRALDAVTGTVLVALGLRLATEHS
jgi:threonine/homoserine/homoserine lactone efflux protein